MHTDGQVHHSHSHSLSQAQAQSQSQAQTQRLFRLLCLHVLLAGFVFFQNFYLDFTAIQLIQLSFVAFYAMGSPCWACIAGRVLRSGTCSALLAGFFLAMLAGGWLNLPTALGDRVGGDVHVYPGQLLTHVAFALVAFDTCQRHLEKGLPGFHFIYLAIFLPVLAVGLIYWANWILQGCSADSCTHWVGNPPIHFNIRAMGFQAMITLIMASVFFFDSYTGRSRPLLALTVAAIFVANTLLFWGGGRTTIVAALLVLVALIFWKRRKPIYRRTQLIWGGLMLASTALAETIAFSGSLGFFNRLFRAEKLTSFNAFSSHREQMWRDSFAWIMEAPWFGYGANAFSNLQIWPGHVQPHSVIVQLLLDSGIVGTLLFSAFMALFVLRNRSSLTGAHFHPATYGLCGLLGLGLAGATDGTFYHAQPLFFVTMSMVLIALCPQPCSSNPRER